MFIASAVEAIGETPLVELSRLARGLSGRLFAKLEYLNPGFSKKDRIARQIIEDAATDGALKLGQTVVEMTSGNTGTGLAIVCGVMGYPFIAVISKGNSTERVRMMQALGAEVVLVDQMPGAKPGQVSGDDLERVNVATDLIVRERGAYRADQFHHRGNFRAHYLHTGREIIRDAPVAIDVFCDFAGSGGTFAGCAAALLEHNPRTRCYVVEPQGAAVLAGGATSSLSHPIQGGGYGMAELAMLNRDHIHGFLQVSGAAAKEAARTLAQTEGIFAGFSSGANVAAALQLLQGEHQGAAVVITINDSGLKYLSTDLWDSP